MLNPMRDKNEGKGPAGKKEGMEPATTALVQRAGKKKAMVQKNKNNQ